MTYIISCPVSSATEDYCDGRYDMEFDRELARVDNDDLAEALGESDICRAEIEEAYIAIADALFALEKATSGDALSQSDQVELNALLAIARVARRETEKLATAIAHKRIAERLED